jgi:hypothetical protein
MSGPYQGHIRVISGPGITYVYLQTLLIIRLFLDVHDILIPSQLNENIVLQPLYISRWFPEASVFSIAVEVINNVSVTY